MLDRVVEHGDLLRVLPEGPATLSSNGKRTPCGRGRGESTGPHLHFEIWDSGGRKLDPLMWLRGKKIMAW